MSDTPYNIGVGLPEVTVANTPQNNALTATQSDGRQLISQIVNALTVSSVSGTVTASFGEIVMSPGTNGATLTLPLANTLAGSHVTVINTNTNTTTISPTSPETINAGTNSATLSTAFAKSTFIALSTANAALAGTNWIKL